MHRDQNEDDLEIGRADGLSFGDGSDFPELDLRDNVDEVYQDDMIKALEEKYGYPLLN